MSNLREAAERAVEDYYDSDGRLHYLPTNENSTQTLPNADVSDVSDVQPNTGAGFGDTSHDTADVSDVSGNKIPPLEDRPKYLVLDGWLEDGNKKYRPGVWYFGVRTGKDRGEDIPTETWICSPVRVSAITHDKDLNNFGRLLKFKTSVGTYRAWPMPMEMLKGSGEEMRGELLSMGVEIDPANRNQLSNYIQSQHPEKRVSCVTRTGWYEGNFVLPDKVIGSSEGEIIFQNGTSSFKEFVGAGTLGGWMEIPRLATGNPMMTFALSAAFAGVLLDKCGMSGGGVHFFGDSSTGKTTLADAACSVWGGENYRRSWKATANGLEGAALLFNDNLLCLDEISECESSEVSKIVYSLGNGLGKQRANRNGDARSLNRWKCFIISNGERTIETSIQEGGKSAKAGQLVRLLDVPVLRKHGAFDDLRGMPSGAALSDKIKCIASSHYGHAGRAFLEKLTRDNRDFRQYLEKFKSLSVFTGSDESGQFKRVAARLALVCIAGELATEYGLTGWNEGDSLNAATEALKAWQSVRGKGNREQHQILNKVEDFISCHGDSRFSDADGNDRDTPMIRDRAGWWRDINDTRVYLFTSAGLREALKGFDFNRALDALQDAGAIAKHGNNGERAKFVRINGRGMKLYPVQLPGSEYGA